VAIVTASFWMRGRIGFATWRRLHYASFGAYLLALVHGLLAGSDTGVPVVAAIYVGSAAVVAGLILFRLDSRSRTAGAASPAAEAFSRRSA
jgi:sulfoxide reductase heme-binding subunit YedZ